MSVDELRRAMIAVQLSLPDNKKLEHIQAVKDFSKGCQATSANVHEILEALRPLITK